MPRIDRTTPTDRPLGTADIPGATVTEHGFKVDAAAHGQAWADATSSAGPCWVGFGETGAIVALARFEYEDEDEDPFDGRAARAEVLATPGVVAICEFVASAGVLFFPRSVSVLTGKVHGPDPTLGLDGSVTYLNGETVHYVRGIRVDSAHAELTVRTSLA